MDVNSYLSIAKLLNDCPNCNYNMIGTNETTGEFHGALNVNENLFTRKCRCGFEVTVDSDKGITKKVIKSQIDKVLEQFNVK